MVGYSVKVEGENYARAMGVDLPISMKDAIAVCAFLKGKDLQYAKNYLEDVVAKKKAIPYRRFLDSRSHRKGGMGPGRYPVKVAKHVLKVLENAENNADYKDMDVDNLQIFHIAAKKGMTMKRYMSRAHGRSTPFFKGHVHIEVILNEKESGE